MSLVRTDVCRKECAKLVEAMIHQAPWKNQQWARGALAIAARAIRRGRHLTDEEKLHNLADALADDISAAKEGLNGPHVQ